jgi:hypothetical protein
MEAPPLERKLVAILAADIQGYSRLMSIAEEDTLATLSAHRAITRVDPSGRRVEVQRFPANPQRRCALVHTRHFKKYSSKFQRLNELL